MKIHLRITPTEGEPYEVSTTLRVKIDWERKYNRSLVKTWMAENPAHGLSFEHIAFLAWQSAKLAGIPVPMSLDGFIDKVEWVEMLGEEADEANPTPATRSDAD